MIYQSDILRYSSGTSIRKSEQVVNEALRAGQQTAFLSHSHKDKELAKGLQGFLQSQGWLVYIDWEDVTMPATPNRDTARKIKDRIKGLYWFLFLATANSSASKWCPWEIGFADGVKDIERIVIVPTRDSEGRNHGSEYLDLYRHVDLAQSGRYALFDPITKRGQLLEHVLR